MVVGIIIDYLEWEVKSWQSIMTSAQEEEGETGFWYSKFPESLLEPGKEIDEKSRTDRYQECKVTRERLLTQWQRLMEAGQDIIVEAIPVNLQPDVVQSLQMQFFPALQIYVNDLTKMWVINTAPPSANLAAVVKKKCSETQSSTEEPSPTEWTKFQAQLVQVQQAKEGFAVKMQETLEASLVAQTKEREDFGQGHEQFQLQLDEKTRTSSYFPKLVEKLKSSLQVIGCSLTYDGDDDKGKLWMGHGFHPKRGLMTTERRSEPTFRPMLDDGKDSEGLPKWVVVIQQVLTTRWKRFQSKKESYLKFVRDSILQERIVSPPNVTGFNLKIPPVLKEDPHRHDILSEMMDELSQAWCVQLGDSYIYIELQKGNSLPGSWSRASSSYPSSW